MKALLYMSKRKWINKLKQLKKKPVNLILSIVWQPILFFNHSCSYGFSKSKFSNTILAAGRIDGMGTLQFFINLRLMQNEKVLFSIQAMHILFYSADSPKNNLALWRGV
mgnify:CR=1 FL=1